MSNALWLMIANDEAFVADDGSSNGVWRFWWGVWVVLTPVIASLVADQSLALLAGTGGTGELS